MDPWRLTTKAQRRINALTGVALASSVLAWLAGFTLASSGNTGAASIENAGATSIAERHDPPPVARTERTNIPQIIALASASIGDVDVPPAKLPLLDKASASTADAYRYEPISLFEISLTDSSQTVPPDAPSLEEATLNTPDPELDNLPRTIGTLEINEECLVAEICIDRYLWALYERAPKVDAIKVHEQRKVKIKRKGKMVTVTRTFTKRVDENFAWKDPKAADRVGMAMMDYVIGGMDRSFKLKLFYTLYAAEQAGLQPGITSAFRDDYRQSIATGLKAATERSYHGGSLRGGYGRGLAADVVSVKGNSRAQRWVSTEKLWKWIDERGKDFGIGRPYLNRDPPHVAPIDGQEYVSRRGGAKTQEAEATTKKVNRVAARADRGKAKPTKTAQARAVKTASAKAALAKAALAKSAQARTAKTARLSKGRTM
jgi:hypothetical protein